MSQVRKPKRLGFRTSSSDASVIKRDRKSTRLNSSHVSISYAVFCLKKKTGMRVLLIEDDSATSQSIELMLKSESFNVYTTDLGEEGVDLWQLYAYNIILLDLNPPDI